MSAESARAVLARWLEAIGARDLDTCVSLLAPDVLVRVPLAPPGVPTRVHGRDAFAPVLRGVHARFVSFAWKDLELFGTDDLEVAIATAGSIAELSDGRSYVNDCVVFARVRGGLVIEYREYLDPIRAGAALAPTDS